MDKRGRPKGRKLLRGGTKVQATMSMTPEAWAILTKKAKDLGIYKSDYVENLVRRGDLPTYDMTIEFLIALLLELRSDINDLEATKVELMERTAKIEKFLRDIGVNSFMIP